MAQFRKSFLFLSIFFLFTFLHAQVFIPFGYWTKKEYLVGITVSQSVVSGGIGASATITAQAIYSPSRSANVTNSATWTSSNPAVATVSNGVISYVAAGTATVTATYGPFSQNISVTVAAKTLLSIAVTPTNSSMAVNATKDYTATATYSDASTQDVTLSVTWVSTNTGFATISNTAPTRGRATGVAAGTTSIQATLGAITGSTNLTITTATLTSLAITPYDALVSTGSNTQLTATGTFSDASTANITNQVTWTSSNTAAATISNATGSRGLTTAGSFTGYRTTTITATLGAVSNTSPFGVNGSAITSIIVKPIVTITVGSTYNLQAWANLADGGTIEITNSAVWTSATPARVTVSNSVGQMGLVTGVSAGTSVITASYGGFSGTQTVTVGASSSVTDVGIGLTADYYNWTGAAPPSFVPANKKGTRIDKNVDFAWGAGAAPMGVSDLFMVRWTGFYKATAATNFFCTYSDDGIRMWLNGTQIINNFTDHGPTWNCSGSIALTVGTKYTIVVEFYENGGGAEAHVTRSSASAAAAQNLANAIPQVDLYPY